MEEQTPGIPGITMCKVLDLSDDKIWKKFHIPLANSRPAKSIFIPNNEPLSKIARELRLYTDEISPTLSIARAQIEKIIQSAPASLILGLRCQGWHEDVYVTQDWKSGDPDNKFCYLHKENTLKNNRKGSISRYKEGVIKPSLDSSYLSFCLMSGLSGPIFKYAHLPEGAVFHLYGSSTSGKTTCAKVAETVSRSGYDLPGWHQTLRRMQELAAERRDQLLTLNAAEKARAKDQAIILHTLTHEISEGDGKGRSQAVQEWLPNQTSRSPVLSTGNYSGAAMARASGIEWNRQEEARFISIPVPAAVDGGIIDRPHQPRTEEQNRELIEQLIGVAHENYGVVLPKWIRIIRKRKDKVPAYIDEFVLRSGITDPYQVRIARKFGLVFAAGAIAARTKFMPWTVDFVYDVVHSLMARAFESVVYELTPSRAVALLRTAVLGKGKLPSLKKRRLRHTSSSIGGFIYKKKGHLKIALRRESLPALMGLHESSKTIISMLVKAGVIETGHGGKITQQVPFTLVTARGEEAKSLRMIVVDATKLSRSSDHSTTT